MPSFFFSRCSNTAASRVGATLTLAALAAGCANPSNATTGGFLTEDGGSRAPVVPEGDSDAGPPAPPPSMDAGAADPGAGEVDAGAAAVCGNGVVEGDEACDGNDFGGKTCQSVGLGGGVLTCNAYCGIVTTGCTNKEICTDGSDNDDDFLTDCDDPECAGVAYCSDACAAMDVISSLPVFEYGDTEGKPSTLNPSCSTTTGPEAVFEFTATHTEELEISLSGEDVSLSVRTDCGDAQSEIACVNDDTGYFDTEKITLSVTAGATYFVVVDSEVSPGFFDLSIDPPPKETDCGDLYDDDGDDLLDCEDSDCAGDAECAVGSKGVGEACVSNSDCAASDGDPVCLTASKDFTGGYCSEFCALGGSGCPGDAVCADVGLSSKNGVCLDGCVTDADCRSSYQCLDRGAGKVCSPPAETKCEDLTDDDGDGDIDCRDDDCSGLAICTPGSGALGDPCTKASDCSSWVGDDPICLTDGFSEGYCSEHCNVSCDTDGECIEYLPGGNNICFKKCDTDADCRSGYTCTTHNFFEKVCTP